MKQLVDPEETSAGVSATDTAPTSVTFRSNTVTVSGRLEAPPPEEICGSAGLIQRHVSRLDEPGAVAVMSLTSPHVEEPDAEGAAVRDWLDEVANRARAASPSQEFAEAGVKTALSLERDNLRASRALLLNLVQVIKDQGRGPEASDAPHGSSDQ